MITLYDIIGTPFGYLMSWIYGIVNNYGIAIILFTVVTKLIFFPVNYSTQKNSARMRLLNPKLEKLRKSYANNPTRLQEEQQKLYQQEGLNPMASCLPAFIQMFLIFGVIDVVYKPFTHILHLGKNVRESIINIASGLSEKAGGKTIVMSDLRCELRAMEQISIPENASKFESIGSDIMNQISELTSHFKLFGADLGKTPEFRPDTWTKESFILFLIPILAGLAQLLSTIYTQWYQKKTNPNMQGMGCMGVMLYPMSLMSVWFAYQVPAGVGFYWIWSSVFSFIITLLLNMYFTNERTVKINEKEREKARIYAEKHPEKKTFMQRMLEQQQALEQQQNGGRPVGENGKISRSEMNKYNRDRINEARKRMAEKYGDVYDDNNED
ncbi:MAG: YidC/Oxa1 family membrane protein insertase [Ruminococcus sp.]|nr:YidC/Oxa1 family membrane protein insertase [Ruminococcus sp.]